jgi:hypothetical protein
MDNQKEVEYSKIMEPEMVLNSDRPKGINQPGVTQGVTYVDCNGNTRHKYETLETITSTTAAELKGETYEVQAPEVKDEVVEETVEPVKEAPTTEVPADIVEKPVVEEPATKPKVTPKPKAKAAPKAKPKTAPKAAPKK